MLSDKLRRATVSLAIDITGTTARAVDRALNTLVTAPVELFPGASRV